MRQKNCAVCGNIFKQVTGNAGLYCSRKCYFEGRERLNFTKLIEGEYKPSSRPSMRRHLIKENGHRCTVCNTSEWMGSPVPLELDHIDGNAGNNKKDNLRLICPNCHAQTPTFKAKNKGSGRSTRKLPLY